MMPSMKVEDADGFRDRVKVAVVKEMQMSLRMG